MPYRVVQWGTGNVGKHALRAIMERPELDLIGVRVHNPDKVGLDAGEFVGAASVGVLAVGSTDAVLALEPDCVVYTAYDPINDPEAPSALSEVCAVLANGSNVVATSPAHSVYPEGGPPDVLERLQDACRAGQTTFFGSGTSPGFTTDLWPMLMCKFARRVDRILIQEAMSMNEYNSPALMRSMGFGLAPGITAPLDVLLAPDRLSYAPWAGSMHEIAASLGLTIDHFTYGREVAIAEHPVPTSVGVIEPGLAVVVKLTIVGFVGQRDFITFEFVWRLDQAVRPDWPTGHQWDLRIDGDPSFTSTLSTKTSTDAGRTASLHAAAGVVNAIPTVCDAPPGVRTVLDLPTWAGAYVDLDSAI